MRPLKLASLSPASSKCISLWKGLGPASAMEDAVRRMVGSKAAWTMVQNLLILVLYHTVDAPTDNGSFKTTVLSSLRRYLPFICNLIGRATLTNPSSRKADTYD